MEIKMIEIDKLRPNKWNPNEMNKSMLQRLAKEIKRHTFLQPIVVTEDYEIIDGEHRWRAAKELKHSKVPVLITDLNAMEQKIASINLNQIKGEFNPKKYGELIDALKMEYSPEQLNEYIGISDKDIEAYDILKELPEDYSEDIDELQKDSNGLTTLNFRVNPEELEKVNKALAYTQIENKNVAFMEMVDGYVYYMEEKNKK